MGGIELKIHGYLKKISTPGFQQINKMLEEKILPIVVDTVTNDIYLKSVEYASGVSLPDQKVPQQAEHPIGHSSSGYNSTGALAESIKISEKGKDSAIISTDLEYASWLEWGTGKWGPTGHKIFPTKGSLMVFPFQGKTIAAAFTLGQRPNPFMRGSMWFIIDNVSPTVAKIQDKINEMGV